MDSLQSTSSIRSTERLKAMIIVLVLLILPIWGVILSGNRAGRGAADDLNYHWIAIQQFADQWPTPDLSDYASATTPGYHLCLSWFAKIGVAHQGIQLIASAWTLGLFTLLAWVVSRRWGLGSVVLMLPLLASMYLLFPGIWLLPDNAGWLGVIAIVLLSLNQNSSWKHWVFSGLIVFVLVWMRQIHIWAAGLIWLSAWLGNESQTPAFRQLFSSIVERAGRTLIAVGCTIPAFAALIWFMGMWEGLVPPTFQDHHQGPNPATPAFILTQLSIISVFFAPMLFDRLKETWKYHWRWVLLAIAFGFLIGIIPESSYSYDEGRYSGWWNLINKLPVIAERSPIILLGSIAGSLALVCWLSLCSLRDIWIWVGLLVAFTLAQSANHASWQRYHEPMLLMMLLIIIARSCSISKYTRGLMIGSIVLAAMYAALTVSSMLNAQPIG